jgi:XTP/dITP diphosphohydrolase
MGNIRGANRILAATGNQNKFKELSLTAKEFGIELVHPADFAKENGLGQWPDPDETGATYRENALIKAKAYCDWSGIDSLGDDSGLEVTLLDNRPGVRSARYGGLDLDDSGRIDVVLKEYQEVSALSGKQDRSAVFRCSLALASLDGNIRYADSELWGELLMERRGSGGFGYDPVIYINSIGATLAEVDFSVTLAKGFRPQAARQLFSALGVGLK